MQSFFTYRNGMLHAEDMPVQKIADSVGTPFYCYTTAALEHYYRMFQAALPEVQIHYALKANANIAVVRTLANLGAGADVVSEGELRLALAAGIAPQRIVFSGVGKTPEEIAFALQTGIGQLNVESEAELKVIHRVAAALGSMAPISFRVNLDIDAHTHHKITTSRKEDKFGIDWLKIPILFQLTKNLPYLKVVGLAIHIGSQIINLQSFKDAFMRMRGIITDLRASGFVIQRVDLGGGLGVLYDNAEVLPPSPRAYASVIQETLGDCHCQILLEPGRFLVAHAGILVTRVLYVKEGSNKIFVIVDAAMNDFIRPSFYGAFHDILPVREPSSDMGYQVVDVVGPICETSDVFAQKRSLVQVFPGDLLAFNTAGAYGATMASTYNMRPLLAEVLVNGEQYSIVQRRQSYEEMFALQTLPPWLEK